MAASVPAIFTAVLRAIAGSLGGTGRFAGAVSAITHRSGGLACTGDTLLVGLTVATRTTTAVISALHSSAIRDARTVLFALPFFASLPVGTIAATAVASIGAAFDPGTLGNTSPFYTGFPCAGESSYAFTAGTTTPIGTALLARTVRGTTLFALAPSRPIVLAYLDSG